MATLHSEDARHAVEAGIRAFRNNFMENMYPEINNFSYHLQVWRQQDKAFADDRSHPETRILYTVSDFGEIGIPK